jgi:hypothetical protein
MAARWPPADRDAKLERRAAGARRHAGNARADLACRTPGDLRRWWRPIVDLAFLPALGVFLLANLAVQLDALDMLPGVGSIGLRVTLDLFVLLIALIGGRIVPGFTANALAALGQSDGVRAFSLRHRLAIGALVTLLLAGLAGLAAVAAGSRSPPRRSTAGVCVAGKAAARSGSRSSGYCTSAILGWPWSWPGAGWSNRLASCRRSTPPTASRSERSAV